MTLIKKRDVKDYFAARRRQGSPIHKVPQRQRDSTVVPDAVSAKVPATPLELVLPPSQASEAHGLLEESDL